MDCESLSLFIPSLRVQGLVGWLTEESTKVPGLKTQLPTDSTKGLALFLPNYKEIIWIVLLSLLLGKISVTQWAFSMENILGLNLPWRTLSSHLVHIDKDGYADYLTSFQDIRIEKPVKEASNTQPQLQAVWAKHPLYDF